MGQATYVVLLFAWALPVIVLQWVVGHRKLRARRGVLTQGVLLPTVYLFLTDVLAIRTGIWSFNPERTLNLCFGGLPHEKALFFRVTNLIVVQGGFAQEGPAAQKV